MGNTQTCGFGVLNKSNIKQINVGLSMAATHKFENGIKPGEIFYRWPGAVHYTVYAYARQPDGSNDITEGQVAKEVSLGVFIYGAIAGVTVATMGSMLSPAAIALAPLAMTGGVATLTAEAAVIGAIEGVAVYGTAKAAEHALGLAFKESNLYCQLKGCYGGGDGSWLIVEGGPYMDSAGLWQPQDLKIRQVTQREIFMSGHFTRYSHSDFHTKDNMQCTQSCPHC